MRILLVEDEHAVQEVMVTMLERAGHLVVAETNGNKAFRRYRKEGPFDLVLADLQHKAMNGLKLMQSIHKKNRKQHVRLVTRQFIFLTKKLRKELRKGLEVLHREVKNQLQKIASGVSLLHQDIQQSTDAINKSTDADRQRDKSPPPALFAELQLPHSYQADKRASDRRKQRRERWALFVQWITFFSVLYYAIVVHKQLGEMKIATQAAKEVGSDC